MSSLWSGLVAFQVVRFGSTSFARFWVRGRVRFGSGGLPAQAREVQSCSDGRWGTCSKPGVKSGESHIQPLEEPLGVAYHGRVRDMNSKRAEWATGVGQARSRARLALASLLGMAFVHAIFGVVSVAEVERGALASAVISLGEVAATLYHNLGLRPESTTLPDPTGRPQYLVEGQPIKELI